MKKNIMFLVLALAMPQVAMAQFNPSGGHSTRFDTVVSALDAPDETAVVLTGKIVERSHSETYRFRDEAGEIWLHSVEAIRSADGSD